MDVKIVCTRSCTHRPNLARELDALGVPYEIVFVEDYPEIAERYHIRHSPNLVIDDEVVFRGQPTEKELKELLGRRREG